MDLKIIIGRKIKEARLSRKLTQQELCDDETELTVRQLTRIETGQALISLPKLIYVAEQLDIPVQEFLEEQPIMLSKRYLELKNKLIKQHTYGDSERIKIQEAMFDEIYDDFFYDLPEEEQLVIEVLQVQLDVFSSRNANYGIGLLEEYFHQVLKKRSYSYNDLLLVWLYFICCAIGLEDKSHFEELSQNILEHIDYSDNEKVYLLERIILVILSEIEAEKYPLYLAALKELVKESQNFQHQAAIHAFEAKYHVLVTGN